MTIKKKKYIYIYIIYIEPLRTGTAFPGKLLSGKNRAVRISLCLEVDLSAIAAFWIVHSPGHFAHGAGLLLVDAEDPYRIYRQ